MPKVDLPKVDLPKVDIAAVRAQATDRATETAKSVKDGVVHTVELIREAVGKGQKPAA
jgi:hypothetical protein